MNATCTAALLLSKPPSSSSSSSSNSLSCNIVLFTPRQRHNGLDDVYTHALHSYCFEDPMTSLHHLDAFVSSHSQMLFGSDNNNNSSNNDSSNNDSSNNDNHHGEDDEDADRANSNSKSNSNPKEITWHIACTHPSISHNKKLSKVLYALLYPHQDPEEEPSFGSSIPLLSSCKTNTATAHIHTSMERLFTSGSPQHLAFKSNEQFQNALTVKTFGLLLEREHHLLLECDDLVGKVELVHGSLDSYLNMDRIAMESIGVDHLYELLNVNATKMGQRILKQWLRQPLTDVEVIRKRQDTVAALVEDSSVRDRLRDALRGCTDLDRLATKFNTNKAKLEHLYEAYVYSSVQLPLLVDELSQMGNDLEKNTLKVLKNASGHLKSLEQLTEQVLDIDAAPRNFRIRAEFDESLAEIQNSMVEVEEEMQEELNYVRDSLNLNSVIKLEQESSSSKSSDLYTYKFRLISKHTKDSTMLERTAGVRTHKILKNGLYFTTVNLRKCNEELSDLKDRYDSAQSTIVSDAMEVAATYAPVLEQLSVEIGRLDVKCSLAHVAAMDPNGYCRPTFTKGASLNVQRARHPCVEQTTESFVPNDYSLVQDYRNNNSGLILVTGPNMGGKSTYIRALGALACMAQIGSFVPAETCELVHPFSSILCRVGAGDAQQKGISTFMAEMLEASSILQALEYSNSSRNLVIIDELGRGTSTFDGFGLAWAISEYLVKRYMITNLSKEHSGGVVALFATHFHELTALEHSYPEIVKNCHVTAHKSDNAQQLTFLYEIMDGPCLESFGIQVAEMAHCPQSMIENAKRKAKELECFDYKFRSCEKNKKLKKDKDEKFMREFQSLPLKNVVSPEEKVRLVKSWLGDLTDT